MSHEGRITGRVSADGQFYELVQYGAVKQAIPIAEAHADVKLQAAITRLGWGALS